MDIRDIREIMGLTQAQVADELGVPKQEVIDCEENGETYLLLQYMSAFPINPQVLKNPDVDPFLPSFDQTTPGNRMRLWREENGVSEEEMAAAIGLSPAELKRFEAGEDFQLNRRRGEEIEKKTGMNRKWLMYGDGREKGRSRLRPQLKASPAQSAEPASPAPHPAPNKAAGQRVRQARQEAGLSREQLADLLDLSVSRIAQMESGYIKDQKADHIIDRISAFSDVPKEETPKAAGIRLREARKAAGMTVKEAAAVLGLKYTTLAHLESGYVTGKHADELIEKIRSAPHPSGRLPFDPKAAGIRIREERNKAGLSQKELATIMRAPVTWIAMVELGNVTEKQAENILRRIHGKPVREIMNHRVKPKDQVLLGSNIRDARIRAGLNQKELGNLLRFPQTRISLIERGKVDEATGKKILRMLQAVIENRDNESASAPPAPADRADASRSVKPSLGRAIQEARLAAGLSQKALGEMLGLSQGSISYMEQGKTDEATVKKVLALIREKRTGKA